MRLWSLHPRYLDTRGLVALWREALLAQAVLRGETRGYLRHPQLIRFRGTGAAVDFIASYLWAVHAEACRRGFRFDAGKISRGNPVRRMEVTTGQLDYEWKHLQKKLRCRDSAWLQRWKSVARPRPHPLFRMVAGDAADWEIVRPATEERSRRAEQEQAPIE